MKSSLFGRLFFLRFTFSILSAVLFSFFLSTYLSQQFPFLLWSVTSGAFTGATLQYGALYRQRSV
jgi:hypothetical protein